MKKFFNESDERLLSKIEKISFLKGVNAFSLRGIAFDFYLRSAYAYARISIFARSCYY